ncbi:hypothetical protein [Yoonia sp. BS5-3]|uniref:Uncharacterized protein n=1 Tax=Yoonia phaeophyticola TaxID=3137369 RepID=A0ABZ2V197_9RHOB
MSHRIALSFQIAHDYWGDETVPLKIFPSDPHALAMAGVLAKRSPARIDLIADDDVFDNNQIITVDVTSADTDILALTDGQDWGRTPHLDLSGMTENTDIALVDVPILTDAPRLPGDPLLRVNLPVAAEGTGLITLRLTAVATLWAYYVTGSKGGVDLQVIDQNNNATFEDLGQSPLPDGALARVFRSTQAIPLRYRPDARFTLEALQAPPFDPITLIPVLPAAGVHLRRAADPAARAPLQSDIFVSLW